jgi:SRSO17 transposase
VAVPSSVDDADVVVDPVGWMAGFDELFADVVAPYFFRREPRLRARAYLLGLVSGLERKNGWTLAEFAGEASPDGMQRLLNAAIWDADRVRDALRAYVASHLGGPDPGSAVVLTIDDTGFEKAGTCSAGVQRQYTGTAGKITNCQIGVFLGYASPRGRALVDRELYVPKSWFADRERCAAAGIPDDRAFATKPQLAKMMIARAVAAGLPFGWITGDEAYGDNGPLRAWLEDEHINYVLAVSCDHRIDIGAGKTIRADALAAKVPKRAWQPISCGPGSKGDRLYDWALADAGPHHRLLVRRSISKGELAYYRCYAPGGATLAELVRVAGSRWSIETCFQGGKNEAALDHYQVRKHIAWYRHATLAMAAHAWLAVTAARTARTADTAEPDEPDEPPPEAAAAALACGDDPAREGANSLWTTNRRSGGQ